MNKDETIGFIILAVIVVAIIVSVFGGVSSTPKDDYNQDRAELQWGGF